MDWLNTFMIAICTGYVLGDMLAGIVIMIHMAWDRYKEKHKKDDKAEA